MALKATKQKRYTPEEYLALERKAEEMSEYHFGKIVPRASSDIDHIRIMSNVVCEFGKQLREKEIDVLGVGLKVRDAGSNYFLYPDVLILKDKPIFHDKEKDVILNPTVVVEIYTRETSQFDRNDKFVVYQQFESIKEIMFVSHYQPLVETFCRVKGNSWQHNHAKGLENTLEFNSLNTKIKLSEIYDLVEFEQL
jgi:Uma2 family endonuclease